MEIIAEIGQNHNGDMQLARQLIYSAKENGADVAKFQLYEAQSLFSLEGNPWYEYNCATELSRDDVEFLYKICDEIDMEFMASVFDVERLAWLEALGVKRYKLASRSIYDYKLIDAVIHTGKPILISLGMWEKKAFPEFQSNNIGYLYCISKYPTPFSDIRLSTVDFDRYIGFSDHSVGISASLMAFARGAKIIEKHFTLDKKMYGPDHECSMTPNELLLLSNHKKEFIQCL